MVIAGVLMIVLGVVVGVVGVVVGFSTLTGLEVEPVVGTTVVTAEEGEELAIYRIGGAAEGSCTAVGPDGAPLPARTPFGTETLTIDGVEYGVHRVLEVEASGPQSVSCGGPGFAVGPRVGVFGLVGTILGGVFGGIALVVAGIVVLIIGIVRGRPPRGPQQPWPPQQPPRQWSPQHPPPQQPQWSPQHPPQQPPPQW